MAIAQRSVAAMGGPTATLSGAETGASGPDSVATGTLTLHAKNVKEGNVIPIALKTKGTNRVRLELQRPSGTTVRILNNGRGTMQRPDGTVRPLLMNNTYGERVGHIPAFSLLAENQVPTVELESLPEKVTAGQATDSVALSVVPTSDPEQAPHFRAQTRTTFEIDRATGFVTRMGYPLAAENDSNVVQQIEVEFSDYRVVAGVAVPFHQKSYANGKPEAELILDSVSFQVQLSDSEFELTKGDR
ncbi:MAG: hypothetical protein L0Z53_08880 [Acidobacteriales bacterium]|nr:hypothetical protein [Terriglobales bacterium]